jgi:hypothetical protein
MCFVRFVGHKLCDIFNESILFSGCTQETTNLEKSDFRDIDYPSLKTPTLEAT